MMNPVVWFEVRGQDADKLRRFYGELLGWSFQGIGLTSYGVVPRGERGISGGIGRATADGRGWVTFYTEVPDLAGAVAKAERMGSRVLVPITRLPEASIAVVSDPEGNPVGLCTTA
ncbi:MAG TPA: VOC family protein [Myxococcota bacterium]|nr:VOC family protein [Myxococcota bacterium]